MENDENAQSWPPASDAFRGSAQTPQPICPHCRRKLLSIRSILCNWCGKRIDDAAYLERAAHERAVEDARMRDKVEQELHETVRMGILGRLKTVAKTANAGGGAVLVPPPDSEL